MSDTEVLPIEHWVAVTPKASNDTQWAYMALAFIGRLASNPERYGVNDEVIKAARIVFAHAPEDFLKRALVIQTEANEIARSSSQVADELSSEVTDFLNNN